MPAHPRKITDDFPGKVKIRSQGDAASTEIIVLGSNLEEIKIGCAVEIRIVAPGPKETGVARATITIIGIALEIDAMLDRSEDTGQ